MRRAVLFILTVILGGLVAARAVLPVPAAAAPADWDGEAYNVLPLHFDTGGSTAGSGIVGEMDRYYLARYPTAKGEHTGQLAGRDLILILAENWVPVLDEEAGPALWRLWTEGVRFQEFFAPDWYQPGDGRAFALLSGLTPTTVRGRSSLEWAGKQDIYLPFALARGLGQMGYDCRAWPREAPPGAYEALGFGRVETAEGSDLDAVGAAVQTLAGEGPFFTYCVWSGTDGEPALEWLLWSLESRGRTEDTVICLLTGSDQPLRGSLFLWGAGLEGLRVPEPCSDLDVTPTLLDLFGADYDARLLSGRDVFSGATPLVALYGSAYADWVTDAGSYIAGENTFFQADDRFSGEKEAARYVQQMRRLVYDRYVFDRRVMENNYFRLVMGR